MGSEPRKIRVLARSIYGSNMRQGWAWHWDLFTLPLLGSGRLGFAAEDRDCHAWGEEGRERWFSFRPGGVPPCQEGVSVVLVEGVDEDNGLSGRVSARLHEYRW